MTLTKNVLKLVGIENISSEGLYDRPYIVGKTIPLGTGVYVYVGVGVCVCV